MFDIKSGFIRWTEAFFVGLGQTFLFLPAGYGVNLVTLHRTTGASSRGISSEQHEVMMGMLITKPETLQTLAYVEVVNWTNLLHLSLSTGSLFSILIMSAGFAYVASLSTNRGKGREAVKTTGPIETGHSSASSGPDLNQSKPDPKP